MFFSSCEIHIRWNPTTIIFYPWRSKVWSITLRCPAQAMQSVQAARLSKSKWIAPASLSPEDERWRRNLRMRRTKAPALTECEGVLHRVPADIDHKKATADLKDGVLEILLPKCVQSTKVKALGKNCVESFDN